MNSVRGSDKAPLPEQSILPQTHPALGLLRLAALSAEEGGMLDDESLELMFEQAETGALSGLPPEQVWPELEHGLMGTKPSNMFRALYACGALPEVLPEVAALFGVPQIADDPPQVDIGHHLLRVLDQAAQCNAPLPVRFAALVMNVGKSDSPPEHLPVHYRHVERGRPRIEAICKRFGIADDCRKLALLALVECERVHRVSEVRAGPVAAMLERLGAFDNLQRYALLMQLCACDYRAYRGRANQAYPKAALLEIALKACAGLAPDDRAAAIAAAFGSERWSDESNKPRQDTRMAKTLIAFMEPSQVPPRKILQEAIRNLRFRLSLDEAYAPFKWSGYLPCTLDGEDAGVDIRFADSASRLAEQPQLLHQIGNRTAAILLRGGGDPREQASALILGAVLAHSFGALVQHHGDDSLCAAEQLLEEARAAFNQAQEG